jgi:hypothetical protein
MNVTEGKNITAPTANAVTGLGRADMRTIGFGFFGFAESRGLGLNRYNTAAAMSATTPRPSRSPFRAWRCRKWLSAPALITTRAMIPTTATIKIPPPTNAAVVLPGRSEAR